MELESESSRELWSWSPRVKEFESEIYRVRVRELQSKSPGVMELESEGYGVGVGELWSCSPKVRSLPSEIVQTTYVSWCYEVFQSAK